MSELRHILRTGTSHARYCVGTPELLPVALSQVTLSIQFSRIVGGGQYLRLSNRARDRSLHERNSLLLYHEMLERCKHTNVLFYDTTTRRAWLVSGLTAVLHILSAKLRRIREQASNRHDASFEFPECLHRLQSGDTESALAFFRRYGETVLFRQPEHQTELRRTSLNDHILTMEKGTTRYTTLGDMAKSIIELLDLMRDHTMRDTQRSTIRPNHYLMGWFLEEILNSNAEMRFYQAETKRAAKGWMQYTHDIRAINILCSDLGALIVPRAKNTQDHVPRAVPGGQDLMISTYSTLKYIAQRERASDFPARLTSQLQWDQASSLFDVGVNHDKDGKAHDNLFTCIQRISPVKWRSGVQKSPMTHDIVSAFTRSGTDAALVFGGKSKIPYVWPQHGGSESLHQGRSMTIPEAQRSDDGAREEGSSMAQSTTTRTRLPSFGDIDKHGRDSLEAEGSASGSSIWHKTEELDSAEQDSSILPSVPDFAYNTILNATTGPTRLASAEQDSSISPSALDSGYSTLHADSKHSHLHQSRIPTLLENVPAEKAVSISSTSHLTLSPTEKEHFVTQLAQQLCLGLENSVPVPDLQVNLMSSNMSSLLYYLSRLTSTRAGDETEKTATSAMRQFRE